MKFTGIINFINHRQIYFFCLLSAIFILVGFSYYKFESNQIQDDKYEDLAAIIKIKNETIQEWRKHRLADVKRISNGPLVKREIARFLQNPDAPGAKSALKIQLNINRKDNIYEDALFLDLKGGILLSDSSKPGTLTPALEIAIETAVKERREILSEIYKSSNGMIYIDAVAPISDENGNPLAIILLRTNTANYLYPFIQSWPTPSRTAETLLVCRDGNSVLYLNELRHRSGTALTFRVPITETSIPAVQAVLGRTGKFRNLDYRGRDVLAILDYIPDSKWFIVSKVDADEILTEVRYRAWVVFIIVLLLIIGVAGLAYAINKNFEEAESRKRGEILEKSLREKETLIRELYHRTKNTMMVVVSIMGLNAAKYPENTELQNFVKETALRIQAISVVHQMLYKSNDLSRISIKGYLNELTSLILKSFALPDKRITLDIKVEEQYFVLDTAIPLGIILNELMTNSLKYAFPENRPGRISITLNRSSDDRIIFCFQDDGTGVDSAFDFKRQSSLGLQLIYNIGEQQMQGTVSFENNNGILFRIEFPDNIYGERV